MKKLIVANWKLNPPTHKEAERLVGGVVRGITKHFNAEVVLCPPFTHLYHVSRITYHDKKIKLGAQDVFWEDGGAYTGEISPKMLKSSGVKYVIIGHSERRKWLGETDEMVNKKVLAALRAGLKVILCAGEPERKELGIKNNELRKAKNFVGQQLKKDLAGIKKSSVIGHQSLVIAYEPIWAIGTGRACKPQDAAEMARFIKDFCAKRFALRDLPVLYGGSVNGKNALSFLEREEIDGALVGGASLNVGEFKKMINITSKI